MGCQRRVGRGSSGDGAGGATPEQRPASAFEPTLYLCLRGADPSVVLATCPSGGGSDGGASCARGPATTAASPTAAAAGAQKQCRTPGEALEQSHEWQQQPGRAGTRTLVPSPSESHVPARVPVAVDGAGSKEHHHSGCAIRPRAQSPTSK